MFDDQAKYEKKFKWLIKRYDDNKDGKIGQEETKKTRRPPAGADKTRGADANNDGFITQDEFVGNLHKRAKYKTYAPAFIRKYDKNKDGKLNPDEVMQMRRPLLEADSNKDGFITEDEVVDHAVRANRERKTKTQTSAAVNPLHNESVARHHEKHRRTQRIQ